MSNFKRLKRLVTKPIYSLQCEHCGYWATHPSHCPHCQTRRDESQYALVTN